MSQQSRSMPHLPLAQGDGTGPVESCGVKFHGDQLKILKAPQKFRCRRGIVLFGGGPSKGDKISKYKLGSMSSGAQSRKKRGVVQSITSHRITQVKSQGPWDCIPIPTAKALLPRRPRGRDTQSGGGCLRPSQEVVGALGCIYIYIYVCVCVYVNLYMIHTYIRIIQAEVGHKNP